MLPALLILTNCKEENTDLSEDKIIAEVYSKQLYLSELDGMVSPDKSPQDSALIINAFVERWVRDQLLMREAERHVPKDLNIDDLVRDYRASLIRNNYEKLLVEAQLDSVVTAEEILAYYNENKEQFKLNDKIIRCYFIKVQKDVEQFSELRKWWNNGQQEDIEAMLRFSNEFAETYILENIKWYKTDKVIRHVPRDVFTKSKLTEGFNEIASDDEYYYLIKVLETTSKNKIAPLGFVNDQIIKVILHKRKLQLLDKKKEEIYSLESRRNNIKIYTK